MKKQILSILLCVCMTFGLLPTGIVAAADTEYPLEEEWIKVAGTSDSGENTESGRELQAKYVDQQMRDFGVSSYSSDYGETRIKDANTLAMYRELKKAVTSIAENGGSSKVEMDLSAKPIPGDTDFATIIDYLLVDCPYELYWYDKTQGWYMGYAVNGNGDITKIHLYFLVMTEYQGENYTTENPVVKVPEVSGGTIATAKANAMAVVAEHEDKTDLAKLTAYKDYICENVEYNYDVLDGSVMYGNPWQLVWVFDGDSSTNVVCEGYSKAFQYLCELSEFEDEYFEFYLVDGVLGQNGGSGNHMWNQVTLEDVNYLVDITNADYPSASIAKALFMNSTPDEGTNDGNGYTVTFAPNETSPENVMTLSYAFNDVTKTLYSTEHLKLGQRVHTYENGGSVCDVCGRPKPEDSYLKGDIDLNGIVNLDDAILLFNHSMLPKRFTIEYPGDIDFTQDGLIDIDDAILLFNHSMLPDRVPLP